LDLVVQYGAGLGTSFKRLSSLSFPFPPQREGGREGEREGEAGVAGETEGGAGEVGEKEGEAGVAGEKGGATGQFLLICC
jgi:hypothetical protein